MTKKPKPRHTPKSGKTHPWKCTHSTTEQHKEQLLKNERAVPLRATMGLRK